MLCGVYWNHGKRSNNQDSLVLEEIHTRNGECVLAVIADGVGSLDYGEIASGYIAECLNKWFYQVGWRMFSRSRRYIIRSLNKVLLDAHTKMRIQASRHDVRWGSTCALVCIWKNRYVYMHIGDSEIIELKGHRLNRLKVRHLTSPHRNTKGQLLKCVGSMELGKADYGFGYIPRGGSLLLASDGFVEKLGGAELGDMLHMSGEMTGARMNNRLEKVGEEIDRRGGTDNRSAIWIIR